MIVADASAVQAALMTEGPARKALASQAIYAPHIVDLELSNGIRRLVRFGLLTADQGGFVLGRASQLGITRYPVYGLWERVWELRDNVTPYDAAYVAVAEALECPLVTADGRLSRAPGLRCAVNVVPR